MADSETFAQQLEAEAEKREAEAKTLRAAAGVLRGGPVVTLPSNVVLDTKIDVPPVKRGGAGLTRETYLEAMATEPDREWDPVGLFERLHMDGHVTNVDSTRTMLYRLERAELVTRTGRGVWRLSRPPLGLVSTAHPGS